MGKEATTITPAGRDEALAAIWDIIDVGRTEGPQGSDVGKTPPVKIANGPADSIAKRGISSKVVGPLGMLLGVGKGVVAEYLGIGRGTASRRASKDLPLPPHAAEVVLRLLELDQMAVDTFESQAASSGWLRKPHPMLDGESPLAYARSSHGAQRVKDMLVAMKYGGAL